MDKGSWYQGDNRIGYKRRSDPYYVRNEMDDGIDNVTFTPDPDYTVSISQQTTFGCRFLVGGRRFFFFFTLGRFVFIFGCES